MDTRSSSSGSGEMSINMAAANQMAMDIVVQHALPLARGPRSIKPHGRKYNSYTPEMRTRIAKYAMMAGDLEAAQHFSRELGHKVAVTSVWRFRKTYTRELKRLHQEGGATVAAVSMGDRRRGGSRRGLRSRGVALDDFPNASGREQQMEEGGNGDWIPPTEAEMKVLQAKKERSDKISKLMGDYLLKGYRMLATTCGVCSNILLRDKQQRDYCVACNELDTEHAKDDPALSAEAARSQVRERELILATPPETAQILEHHNGGDLVTPSLCMSTASLGAMQNSELTTLGTPALRVQHIQSLATPSPNPQATVLPQAIGLATNSAPAYPADNPPLHSHQTLQRAEGTANGPSRADAVVKHSMDSVLDKLTWASEELGKTGAVDTSTQLCRLIQACAEALESLKGASQTG
ncbi:uncharacterized protein [Diadema antillarum]|uniref:uncharacterized protein isoform X1 n=1 Tax=Diadema antillarum TaxID=105358 RepID=UPI003A841F91